MMDTTPFRNILYSVHFFSRNKKYMWRPKNVFACIPIFVTILCNTVAILYVSLLFKGGFNINALPLSARTHYILDNLSHIQFIHILPYILSTALFMGMTIGTVVFVLKKIQITNTYHTLQPNIPYAIDTQNIHIPNKITWNYKNSARPRKQKFKDPWVYQNMSVPLNPMTWHRIVKPFFLQSLFLFCIIIPILQIMFMAVCFSTAVTLDSLTTHIFNFTYIAVFFVLFACAMGLIYVAICITLLATDTIYKKTCKWVSSHHPHRKIYTVCQNTLWIFMVNIILISAYLTTLVFLISVVAIAIHFMAYKSLLISMITSFFGFIIFSIIAYIITFSVYVIYAISVHLAMVAYLDINAQDNCTPHMPQTVIPPTPPTDNDNDPNKIYTFTHYQQKTD